MGAKEIEAIGAPVASPDRKRDNLAMPDGNDGQRPPFQIEYRSPTTGPAKHDRLPALWPLLLIGAIGVALALAYGLFVARLPTPFPGGE